MNIALPALVIFIFLSPGVIFRTAFYKGLTKQSAFRQGQWAEEIGFGIPWAILFHAVSIVVIKTTDWLPDPDFKLVVNLVSGSFGKDSEGLLPLSKSINEHFLWIALYLIWINTFGWFFGKVAWSIVCDNRLDTRYPALFNLDNDWYYRLRAIDESGEPGETGERIVEVAAVLVQGGVPYLYCGVLKDYRFDRSGDLDHLELIDVKRRLLSEDWKSEEPKPERREDVYYPVDGDRFILRYKDLSSLNVLYRTVDDLGAVGTEEPHAAD